MKKPSNEIIIRALEKSGGLIAPVAISFGVNRTSVYNWINDDIELKKAQMAAKEALYDMVEGKLIGNIKEGKEASIFFFLKTQCRNRGYQENSTVKLELENNNIDYSVYSEEELRTMDALIAKGRTSKEISN
jgi:hypothetical protein